jgi:hypothetical protein
MKEIHEYIRYPPNYYFFQTILSFFGRENLEKCGNVYYSSVNLTNITILFENSPIFQLNKLKKKETCSKHTTKFLQVLASYLKKVSLNFLDHQPY